MIKIENYDVEGWEHAIRGMRNPMNSWEKSDSGVCENENSCFLCEHHRVSGEREFCTSPIAVGPNDHDLMMRLANAGPVHGKFRRMITVYVDITAPLYWWKEFDTYKVGTVANSCSTMHKIHAKEFTLEDFSCEHLITNNMGRLGCSPMDILENTIEALNINRNAFIKSQKGNSEEAKKMYWWQMIQLLPSSYNQKRTVMLNYEVLANIYEYRRNHKLDEWHGLCDWIEGLPYSEIIIGNPETDLDDNPFVKVIKEQNAEIEALKKKIEELEKKK